MDFFKKVKTKIKIKNFLLAAALIALACLSGFIAIMNGFSAETEWQIGIRGSRSGIPVPNWLISCIILLMCGLFLVSGIHCLIAFIKDPMYKKMLLAVAEIGDAEAVGVALAAMKKNKYAKGGDLRFDQRIIFYMSGTTVTVIPPASIRGFRTEIVAGKRTETNYVCVFYGNEVLKIRTSAKNAVPLLEQMRATFAVQ